VPLLLGQPEPLTVNLSVPAQLVVAEYVTFAEVVPVVAVQQVAVLLQLYVGEATFVVDVKEKGELLVQTNPSH
jgi:hypothetical protein